MALIGTKAEVIKIMVAAKWHPADPLTLRSDLEIAEATVLKRPDDEAPVSNLYLFGRKEDLAFEQPVGHDPRQRHHVRFWRTGQDRADGRPIWVGSAVYDEHVGLSRTTGQITHVTAADVDAERDYLFQVPRTDRRPGRAVRRRRIPQDSRGQERRRRPLAHRRQPLRGGDQATNVLPK